MKFILSLSRNTLMVFALLLVAGQAHAMKAPDVVVKETVDSMVSQLQKNRELYTADNKALYAMLDKTLVPALNVDRMADLILGREVSKSATTAQKKAFISEFKTVSIAELCHWPVKCNR